MKFRYLLFCDLYFVSLSLFSQPVGYTDFNTNGKKDIFEDRSRPVAERVADLLARMTLEEKIGQMVQYPVPSFVGDPNSPDEFVTTNDTQTRECRRLIESGLIGSVHANLRETPENIRKSVSQASKWLQESRLKIPLLVGVDAVHGNSLVRGATIFPNAINLGATFDEDLTRRVSDVTSRESIVLGQNWTMGPNIEVARDMRWGRIGETYGEDPLLVSRMGVACVEGFQKEFKDKYSMAVCIKHFIAGSQPSDGRNNSPAEVSERTLREVFFPPFHAALSAGAASVMLAHNEVNGVPCHSDSLMINGWLKAQPGFRGIVLSDYMDVPRLATMHHVASDEAEACKMAVRAGLDMNMMGPGFYEPVLQGVVNGEIPPGRIEDAVRRILTIKFEMGLFDKPSEEVHDLSEIGSKEHAQLALEAARKSIVLLRNKKNILPLSKGTKALVTGSFAANEALLGDWVSPFESPMTITPLKGLRAVAGEGNVSYFDCGPPEKIGERQISGAVSKSREADVVIVIAGQNPNRSSVPGQKTEGENIDRNTLGLPGNQAAMIEGIARGGKPVIVVYINGGPIADQTVEHYAEAIIEAFYPGMKGGQALAEIIYGEVNPGGRLPYTVPRGAGYQHSWYYQRPSKFSGLRGKYALESPDKGVTPLYEFGFGQSYTRFEYGTLKAPSSVKQGDEFTVSVDVANTGEMDGDEVVLLFVRDVVSRVTTPIKRLTDFRRVPLKKGEVRTLSFRVQPTDLMYLNERLQPELEAGDFEFTVGTFSGTPQKAIVTVN